MTEYERESRSYEWLLTNRLGGYGLGYGNFANQRKYNGLLIASDKLFKRTHILSSVEELVEWRGNMFFMDTNYYRSCIYPTGYEHLVKWWFRPYPRALYSSYPVSKDILVLKEVLMPEGKNAVVVKYSNMGFHPLNLTLRPKFTLRDHHHVNQPGTWNHIPISLHMNGQGFSIRREDIGLEGYGYLERGTLNRNPIVFQEIYYPLEAARGYDSVEDLYAPVTMNISLRKGESISLVVSAEKLANPMKVAKAAEKRYSNHPLPKDDPMGKSFSLSSVKENSNIFKESDYSKILQWAGLDFVAGNDIIAGYPWFGPWGRDTLIAMRNLKQIPVDDDLPTKILKKYGKKIKGGLIPNTFGEGQEGLNYDTIDAPLWYCVRAYEVMKNKGTLDEEVFNNTIRILHNYMHNDSLPFFMDKDGLIEIRPGKQALTWMDAKVHDNPVTPRQGKPVEINALWYNTIKGIAHMSKKLKKKELNHKKWKLDLKGLDQLANQVKESFQKFITPDFLADRIEGGKPVEEVRSNAVTALALPFDLVDLEVMKRVYETAKNELLTPMGLRSLSPRHPGYKKKYIGNQKQRDLAYHQGTTWTFPLEDLALLYVKISNGKVAKTDMVKELDHMVWHYKNGILKGHMASAAEVWDGECPHIPKGTPAQAWSVFALIGIESLRKKIKSGGKK